MAPCYFASIVSGSSKVANGTHSGKCSQGPNSSKGSNNTTILCFTRAKTSTHSRRTAPSHSTRSPTTHPWRDPPPQLMWLHNRDHCCQKHLQPDPLCDAVPGPPSLSRIILSCPGRHISSLLTRPGTLSATSNTHPHQIRQCSHFPQPFPSQFRHSHHHWCSSEKFAI